MKRYQKDFASQWPSMYDKTSRTKRSQRILKLLKIHLKNKSLSSLSVLDVGASSGIIDSILAKHFKKVVGIDIDKKAIEFAKKNFKKQNLTFRVGDAMQIPYKDNSFDIILCTQVYEHVPDQKKLFSEIYRVLKPGGICYLAALNRLWFWEPHYSLPFLSWLPKNLADIYVRSFGKAEEYYETPLTFWALRRLTKKFRVTDYTPKILQSPKSFGYENKLIELFKPLMPLLSPVFTYLTPTMFWILTKPPKTS